MSRDNDILKRDHSSPSDSPSDAGRRWVLPLVVALLVIAVFVLIGVAKRAEKRETNPEPAAAAPAEPVAAPATNAPPVVLHPIEATTSPPSTNPAPGLKLQGIVYDATQPRAIVNGKTVHVGERVGGYRVVEISPGTLTLENTNGATRTLFLGK